VKGFEGKNISIESNADTDGMDMSIDQADMGFIYDLLFNQMYRDPIGSVIREITSNCYDSHYEAGVKDAVVITLGEDDAGYYITFKDVGVGLSPERMDTIYRKPAKSTKRDTNGAIGYWGLGSKSPLAYNDYFELVTVFEGIKYHYTVHKGSKSPRIDLMDQYEVEERNGTVVRVDIKSEADYRVFQRKLPEQLRYFDNVYVVNGWHFNNSYQLHIGKTFKYRNDVGDYEPL
jgi:DNA topoisomerase VI subunit B